MLRLKTICLALLLAVFFVSLVQAADERFTVEINVDVTDSDAAKARERAMNEANRAAIGAVAKRITTADGAARLITMSDAQLINFVKEVSVADEKSSAVRYIANLRVVLNEDMLKEYMRERDIPVLVQSSSKILIVPLFREFSSDKPMLWESSNLWKQAWDQSGSINFVSVPASGINYSIIDAEKAESVDGEALGKLMRVNGADDVYVLDATYDGIDGLIVRAVSYSGDNRTIRVPGSRSAGMELFNSAVHTVKAQLEGKLAEQTLSENSLETTEVVIYNFERLGEWVQVEKALRTVPVVSNIEVQAMGTKKVQFKLSFIGSYDKLVQGLRARSLQLLERGNYFVLEKTLGD